MNAFNGTMINRFEPLEFDNEHEGDGVRTCASLGRNSDWGILSISWNNPVFFSIIT